MKKLKVNLTIKELYNKLLTSNVPTYLLSSQDKLNLGAIKTLKAKKESISLMNIFVFWLKNKYLLARKEEILEANSKKEQVNNEGIIEKSVDGVVTIKGLKNVKSGEVVMIYNGSKGTYVKALVLNLLAESVQGVLLGKETDVVEGDVVYCTNRLFQLVCNLSLFNNVIDALGVSKLTGLVPNTGVLRTVEQKATGIIERVSIDRSLHTGLKVLDSLVPIGRGQRELIIGDRQTGKSSIGVDMILGHVKINESFLETEIELEGLRSIVWFIFCSIGQKQSTVNQVREVLEKKNAFWFTSIVAATAAEPAPLQFLVPYTACTLGEFIRDIIGGHSVVIYDDLSKQAVAYRQMSLLLRRPPGREAFPGDVFYVHSRLLERAGSLTSLSRNKPIDRNWRSLAKKEYVRGTLTAFPVIETQGGDVSAYIATNVISITDGQVFLDTNLFYRGIRPAINVGLSVSRVGSVAQHKLVKKVSGALKMELAQYREFEGFSKLGADIDDDTQAILNRGENLVEILKQDVHKPLSVYEEAFSIFLGLGYKGNWLTDVLNMPLNKNALLNRRRMQKSWFDWFRVMVAGSSISFVRPFVESLLIFLKKIDILKYEYNKSVSNLIEQFLNKSPVIFMDDLIVAYLIEVNCTNFSNTKKGNFLLNSIKTIKTL
jgi:F-type H+-transporting ATPase subunit alpha